MRTVKRYKQTLVLSGSIVFFGILLLIGIDALVSKSCAEGFDHCSGSDLIFSLTGLVVVLSIAVPLFVFVIYYFVYGWLIRNQFTKTVLGLYWFFLLITITLIILLFYISYFSKRIELSDVQSDVSNDKVVPAKIITSPGPTLLAE